MLQNAHGTNLDLALLASSTTSAWLSGVDHTPVYALPDSRVEAKHARDAFDVLFLSTAWSIVMRIRLARHVYILPLRGVATYCGGTYPRLHRGWTDGYDDRLLHNGSRTAKSDRELISRSLQEGQRFIELFSQGPRLCPCATGDDARLANFRLSSTSKRPIAVSQRHSAAVLSGTDDLSSCITAIADVDPNNSLRQMP